MLAPNSSVSPVGIRAKWYYLFFLTLKKYCQISQGSIQGPRLVNLCTQLKLLPCVRKLLHPLLNGKLYCLLGTLTDCSVALVKSRSMVTIPLFSGGKQFLCGGQNNEADYGHHRKKENPKGGTERLYWADTFSGQQHPPGELAAKWEGAEMLGLAVAEITFRTRWVSLKKNPQMLTNLKEN